MSDWLAFGGVALSALVAYHIAVRQNVFARVKILVSLLVPGATEWPWAVIVGIPARPVDYYAFDIPIFVKVGSSGARDLWLQITYERGRHYSEYRHIFDPEALAALDEIRIITHLHHTDVEYTRPSLRADEVCAIADPIVVPANQLSMADGAALPVSTARVHLTFRFENHRQIQRAYWLVAVRSESMDALMKQLSPVVEALFARERVPLRYVWANKFTMLRRRTARVVQISQMGFVHGARRAAFDLTTDYAREIRHADVFPVKGVGSSVTRPTE